MLCLQNRRYRGFFFPAIGILFRIVRLADSDSYRDESRLVMNSRREEIVSGRARFIQRGSRLNEVDLESFLRYSPRNVLIRP